MKLSTCFYVERDALRAARDLLGKVLCTAIDGAVTSGVIMETEAYRGTTDRASHAFGGRRTKRNEMMYAQGGAAYVYLCYGIHHLFNIVVHERDVPDAVLVRAILPLEGLEVMRERRLSPSPATNGPGTLTQALGIKMGHNGQDLTGRLIWIEDRGIRVPPRRCVMGPRVGVDHAGADALLPYRFQVAPSHLNQ